jgi:uncharacterized protein
MPLGKLFKRLADSFKNKSIESDKTNNSDNTSELSKKEENSSIKTTDTQTVKEEITTTENIDIPISKISPKISEENTFTLSESTTNSESTNPEAKFMINISALQNGLQSFVSGSPDIQGAALVSPDGLALASVLPVAMDEERTAAMSASMLSLGERIGRELARGSIDRIVVEGDKGYGVLVGCGKDAVLLVLASSSVKQGILFLEIKRAVARLTPLLA